MHAFQVDLHGVVDLLSRHMYSSPRVYLRELLQNALDAVTARAALDGDANVSGGPDGRVAAVDATGAVDAVEAYQPEIVLEPGESLRVHDNGIGLTEDEVRVLLATIGRSSKRDELGFQRQEFLGQFGIGLLSAFMVADRVDVVTRSAKGGPTIRWSGHADGSYAIEHSGQERPEPGSTVTLTPRRDVAELTSPGVVAELAEEFGGLLPIPISLRTQQDGTADRTINQPGPLPWHRRSSTPAARREELLAYGKRLLGEWPFDVIDLAVPEAGLSGVGFVLPSSVSPTKRHTHRVYLKRMLLSETTEDLLPEWAFFVRCVVNADNLRPTASREALYDDDLLAAARDGLGAGIRRWLTQLGETDPLRLRQFLHLHHTGVKALAAHDDDMLRMVYEWLEFETSAGVSTLAEFRRQHRSIRYTPDVDEFRRLSAVAGAQGIGLVNGGYAYDDAILRRLPTIDPEIELDRVDPTELSTSLGLLEPATELEIRDFVSVANTTLRRLGCEVVIRDFDPASLPALYLSSRDAEFRAGLAQSKEQADELWSEVLGTLENLVTAQQPQLVLNYRNPLARRITRLRNPELTAVAVEALYGQALLTGRHPLRAIDTATLNRSFLGLLDWATHDREDSE